MVPAARTSPEMIIWGDYFSVAGHCRRPLPGIAVQVLQCGGELSDALAERELGRGGAVMHPDLRQDTRDVHLDGIGAEKEPLRDLPIAQPGGHKPQHLDLARGQSRGRTISRAVE